MPFKKCIYDLCDEKPTHNYKKCVAKYCKYHAKKSMVNVIGRYCKNDNCVIQPSYGYKGKSAEYCLTHKKNNMINVRLPRCQIPNCNKIKYVIRKSDGFVFCKSHTPDNIEIMRKKCIIYKCSRHASHNYYGELPLYCYLHANDDMINVKFRKCELKDCYNLPYYSRYMNGQPTICDIHHTNDMFRIQVYYCNETNCKKIAIYGYKQIDYLIPLYCMEHRLFDMTNVQIIRNYIKRLYVALKDDIESLKMLDIKVAERNNEMVITFEQLTIILTMYDYKTWNIWPTVFIQFSLNSNVNKIIEHVKEILYFYPKKDELISVYKISRNNININHLLLMNQELSLNYHYS